MYVKFSIKSKKCGFNYADKCFSFLKKSMRAHGLENMN